jgi:hypothetical protein
MTKDNDFAMSDFTADKARKLAEETIPELVNAKMGECLIMIQAQSKYGEFRVKVNSIVWPILVFRKVEQKLKDLGYDVEIGSNGLIISWYPPNSGD